jgi:hypothetical protein
MLCPKQRETRAPRLIQITGSTRVLTSRRSNRRVARRHHRPLRFFRCIRQPARLSPLIRHLGPLHFHRLRAAMCTCCYMVQLMRVRNMLAHPLFRRNHRSLALPQFPSGSPPSISNGPLHRPFRQNLPQSELLVCRTRHQFDPRDRSRHRRLWLQLMLATRRTTAPHRDGTDTMNPGNHRTSEGRLCQRERMLHLPRPRQRQAKFQLASVKSMIILLCQCLFQRRRLFFVNRA